MPETKMSAKMQASMQYAETDPKSRCKCGHTGDGGNSQHGGLLGHGSCNGPTAKTGVPCPCTKFSWHVWLTNYTRYMSQRGHAIK